MSSTIANPLRPVEAYIDAGRPLSEISRLFPRRLEALRYYADLMASRHSSPGSWECICCGSARNTRAEVYTWEAYVDTRGTVLKTIFVSAVTMLGGFLFSSYHRITFATHHVFCGECAGRFFWRQAGAGALHYLSFALLIVAAIALTMSLAFLGVGFFSAPEMRLPMALVTLASCLPAVLCIGGFKLSRRLAVPEVLRSIGRFPFAFRSKRRWNAGN